jgi:CubicO group peptidase (beta-lactamase class C family)
MKWRERTESYPNWRFWIAIAFYVTPIFSWAQYENSHLRREIEKLIKYEAGIDFSVVPGLTVCIWDMNRQFFFNFGEHVDAHSIFELGSLSKPITAWLAYRALDSLQHPSSTLIATYLPDSLIHGGWKYVTVQQIIEHKAGLPRYSPGLGTIQDDIDDPYLHYDLNQLIRDIQSTDPVPARYGYSHLGYAVLHWLFEQVGGFESFYYAKLRAEPFYHTKLQVGDFRESMDLNVQDSDIVKGHGFDGEFAPVWHTNAMRPALGIKSNVSDFTFWMATTQLVFPNEELKFSSSLRKELQMHKRAGAYKIYKGWFVIPSGNSILLYHNGHTGGHHVSAVCEPSAKRGVTVFANGKAGANDLALSILTMLKRAKVRKKIKTDYYIRGNPKMSNER